MDQRSTSCLVRSLIENFNYELKHEYNGHWYRCSDCLHEWFYPQEIYFKYIEDIHTLFAGHVLEHGHEIDIVWYYSGMSLHSDFDRWIAGLMTDDEYAQSLTKRVNAFQADMDKLTEPKPDYDPHVDYPERYTDGPV